MAEFDNNEHRGDVFSVSVKAGKRTYFFDVRSTKSNDYYLTITESKKKFNEGSDRPFYEKHKIFLYKEDFDKFMDGLTEAVEHIKINRPDRVERVNYYNNSENHNHNSNHTNHTPENDVPKGNSYTDINFEDLGNP
mgnify:CR=1 FL=1